jgi:hypothetical protein
MVLERWTNPKRSRRTCTCEYGLQSCRGKSACVAKRPRERSPTRNPYQSDSQLFGSPTLLLSSSPNPATACRSDANCVTRLSPGLQVGYPNEPRDTFFFFAGAAAIEGSPEYSGGVREHVYSLYRYTTPTHSTLGSLSLSSFGSERRVFDNPHRYAGEPLRRSQDTHTPIRLQEVLLIVRPLNSAFLALHRTHAVYCPANPPTTLYKSGLMSVSLFRAASHRGTT